MKRLAFIILALSTLMISLPAQADRLFTVGFEEDNLIETMWTSTLGSVSVQGTTVHSGSFALQLDVTAAAVVRKFLASNKISGSLFLRWYQRWASFPSSNDKALFLGRSSSGAQAARVSILSASSNIRLQNQVTSTSTDGSETLSVDTWYRFELRWLLSDTVGELELRIFVGDSTTVLETLTITAEDTLPTNVQRMEFGNQTTTMQNTFYDDIGINDEAGAFQNSFPGPGKVFLIEPSGDNTVAWTKDGSAAEATNWEGVDDLPGTPDDGTTYNSATTNITDKLDLSNLGAEVPSDGDIILVDVYARQGSDGTAGTRVIDFELWDEADSQNTLLDVSADLNGWRICDTDEHLVFDAGSRTKANIDSFRVGYSRSIGGSNEIRITAQWVNVEWIEAAVGNTRAIVIGMVIQ